MDVRTEVIVACYAIGGVCLAIAAGIAIGVFTGYLFGSTGTASRWLLPLILVGLVLCLPGWVLL